ncbi:60S acidic ribosomal protein P2-4 [Capsicum annuum]|nr:60S acidic ribosomal protein P2-4 [Capsicum annuum]
MTNFQRISHVAAMVVVALLLGGNIVLSNMAAEDGMSFRVMAAYRWIFSTAFLGPMARSSDPKDIVDGRGLSPRGADENLTKQFRMFEAAPHDSREAPAKKPPPDYCFLSSIGADADDDRIELLLSQVKGKDITELITSGRKKLASVPAGSGGAVAVAVLVGGAAAAPVAEEKKKEKRNLMRTWDVIPISEEEAKNNVVVLATNIYVWITRNDGQQVQHPNSEDDDLGDMELLNPGSPRRVEQIAAPVQRNANRNVRSKEGKITSRAGMGQNAINLILFSLSLSGEATLWLNELTPNSITNWRQLKEAFLERREEERDQDMAHLKMQMDLLTKHLLSGKTQKVKAVGLQSKVKSDSEEEVNYVNNQGFFEAIAKEIKLGLIMKRLDIRTRSKNDGSCMAITTRSGKILPVPSVGKSGVEDMTEVNDEPKEECPVESGKLESSNDAPE